MSIKSVGPGIQSEGVFGRPRCFFLVERAIPLGEGGNATPCRIVPGYLLKVLVSGIDQARLGTLRARGACK